MKGLKMMFFMILMVSFVFGVAGCGKKEEAKKIQTVANNPLPDGFKVKISIENPPASIKINSSTHIKVKVKNISRVVWSSKGKPNGQYWINLSYHWLDKGDSIIVFDGLRTSLPYDINPDREVTLDALVSAPNETGEYILEWDMVQEGVSWFKDKGSKTTRIPVKIE